MRRRAARRAANKILRENPNFSKWLLSDSNRVKEIRANPEIVQTWHQKWREQNFGKLNLYNLTEKTRRANEWLTKVQSALENMSNPDKKDTTTP
ncbi:hypothetical protein [Brevibacillus fulvus]|uniref:16S rRNA C967 or C1407 C5-methylase (RsmB/RsmF family) n=1 Tax=Brevibacillus fulvus TaxID=1125967 RepID=A0A938Y0N8_9BACL|nr:hypothetical protein [Brevibacillus fulvus]MBM7588985.1 16S rRNA C967 or C1407 C5-methylase (RsmB/RsmF family) [Brevibacillus fulvus]